MYVFILTVGAQSVQFVVVKDDQVVKNCLYIFFFLINTWVHVHVCSLILTMDAQIMQFVVVEAKH